MLNKPESCFELLSQVHTQYAAPILDLPIHDLIRNTRLSYDQSLELHGLSGSGKTHLLYLLTIEAVLAGRAVIVFDTDLKWDNSRLLHLITARLTDGEGVGIFGAVDYSHLLDLVYIFQPQSAASFRADAESIVQLCLHELHDKAVRYVLVDSLSSFHWQALATQETSNVDIYLALQKAAEQISALLVYTTWDIGFNYINMPRSTRLLVDRKYVLQFTQGLEQAVETRDARMEVLKRGIFYLSSENREHRVAFYVKHNSCGALHD